MNNDPFVTAVGEFAELYCGMSVSDHTPVIVALSGGADSVALLAVLVDLGYNCVAAHCNYHLRGTESDRDAEHAKKIANILGATFIMKDFDVEAFCASSKESSVENACRILRYQWFDELMSNYGAGKIAVGHNSDDNCETLLFNLIRGTGLKGLHGILPVNDNNIVRPLLSQSRKEIEEYLNRRGLGFVTDSSNLENKFSRNRIRNIILRDIDSCFPNGRKGIIKTIENIRVQESLYKQCLAEKQNLYSDNESAINLSALVRGEKYPAMLLFEWENARGMTYTQAENIIKSHTNTGSHFYSDRFVWTINKGQLIRSDLKSENSSEFESVFEITVHPVAEFKITNNPNEAYFDISVLKNGTLDLRYILPGDRIYPFGMKGKKKVSDLMAEYGVPLALKSRIPLLVKDNDILWIPGVRASSLYPVTSDSIQFISVTWKNPFKF